MTKLSTLINALNKLGLSKYAYINEARLVYGYSNHWYCGESSPTIELYGVINNEYSVFGWIVSCVVEIGGETYYQPHIHIDEPYIGLGYGKILGAAMGNLANTNGYKLLLAPHDGSILSDNGIEFLSIVKSVSGIQIEKIVIINDELFPVTDIKAYVDNSKDILPDDKNKLSRYLCKYVDLMDISSRKDELEYRGYSFDISVGYRIKCPNLPVPIPVQMKSEFDKKSDKYEDRAERDDNIIKLRGLK